MKQTLAKSGSFFYEAISLKEMAVRKFGKLRLERPEAITPGSGKKLQWVCDCGRTVTLRVCDVVSNPNRDCDKCSWYSEERMKGLFGNLRMKFPREINPWSHAKEIWVCECGKECEKQVRNVVQGITKTCGKCKEISVEIFANTKYGRLRMKSTEAFTSGSNKKVWWICSCGNETQAQITSVVAGRTKSCGKCHQSIAKAYIRDKEKILALRTPINSGDAPDSVPRILDTITSVKIPFRAECRLCGSEYAPRWSGVRKGISLTCGCSSSRISSKQTEISEFIAGLGFEVKNEEVFGGLKYDIWVPAKNLVIEFNGIRWHSYKESKSRDIRKHKNAIENGMDFLMIFEDEWRHSPHKVKSLISNRLLVSVPRHVRPQKCQLTRVDWKLADDFLEKHHYIGGAKAPVNYAVIHEEKLIGVCSFKRPSRQSQHPWELVRMVMDPDYRVHGIWSQIIRKFVQDFSPTTIVTFSDNRLFNGRVYEKIGFKRDGEVRPDYYWTKSDNRYHKSSLRKTEEERKTGKTEVELREAQGYRQIWDLGKTRWVYKNL